MSEQQFNEYLKEFEPVIKHKSGYKIAGMDKDDIAQEIRLRLFIKKDTFDPQKTKFGTWARVVADNCIKNLIRDSKTNKASYLNDAIPLENVLYDEELDKNH